ncbi:MAG: hypothetical protein HYV97_02060 [Bdellovibrio sp.]|nr:hypothetical protein [Bdellovibrio sp.]
MKLFIHTIVVLTFTGCASTIRVPTNSFIKSENIGQAGASIETFVTQGRRLQAAQDYRATPIDNTPSMNDTLALGFQGTLGFLNALEFYWGWVPGGPNTAGLKFQLWGESLRASKRGNFSLALALGSGLYVASGAIPSESVQGSSSTERRGFVTEYAAPHGELSFGFRPLDILLVNLGYYRSKISYAVTFDEGIRDVYQHMGTLTILHLGTNLKYSIFLLGIDIAKSQLTLGAVSSSELSFGLNSGLAW